MPSVIEPSLLQQPISQFRVLLFKRKVLSFTFQPLHLHLHSN